MNKRIKKKWLKALRSDKYRQGFDVLRSVNQFGQTTGFCCLGVLCNIHAKEHPDIAQAQKYPDSYMGSVGVLPMSVSEWAGIESEDGFFTTKKGREASLADLNDNGKTFKQIANYIEKFF